MYGAAWSTRPRDNAAGQIEIGTIKWDQSGLLPFKVEGSPAPFMFSIYLVNSDTKRISLRITFEEDHITMYMFIFKKITQ